MNDELYNRWRRRRADVEPPAGFPDRVMDAIRREPPLPRKGFFFALLASAPLRAAACALACLVCLYRLASVVAVFFPQ